MFVVGSNGKAPDSSFILFKKQKPLAASYDTSAVLFEKVTDSFLIINIAKMSGE